MNPGVVKVDSLAIQQTMAKLADMLADLGTKTTKADSTWGKVREEINTPGMFINLAIRNPVSMAHLKEIDRYLKALAEEVQVVLSQPPNKDTELYQQALEWISDAYEDIKDAIKR